MILNRKVLVYCYYIKQTKQQGFVGHFKDRGLQRTVSGRSRSAGQAGRQDALG